MPRVERAGKKGQYWDNQNSMLNRQETTSQWKRSRTNIKISKKSSEWKNYAICQIWITLNVLASDFEIDSIRNPIMEYFTINISHYDFAFEKVIK